MTKAELLSLSFNEISNHTKKRFVILSSIENDIDILILSKHIQPTVNALMSLGYTGYQDQNPCHYGAEPHIHLKHEDCKIHLDIVTGLYYRSLSNPNLFINIDSSLTRSALDNRVSTEKIYHYHLDPLDEITHLICHCIFDKRAVTERYEARILHLLNEIDPNLLKIKLDKIFYKASDLIYNSLLMQDIKNLFLKYLTFTDY